MGYISLRGKLRWINSWLIPTLFTFFVVVLTVSAATTVSTNINTGGTLTVSGASTLTGNVSAAGTLSVTGASTLTGAVSAGGALAVAGNSTFTGDLFVNGADINLGTGSATSTLTSASGFLGIGTTTPARFFSVQGNGLFSGDLFSAGLTATGTVLFTGTAATTTLSGGLLVDTTTLTVDYSTDRVGVGTTSPRQTFGVQGNGLFSGDVTMAGLTATGTVAFNGASATTTITGGLLVDTTTFMADFSTNRVGFGTTSPGQEAAFVGDVLHSSGATTTLSVQTTSTTIGGCIQLRSTDNKNYRIYAAASSSNSGMLQVEVGDCQAQ